MLVNYVDLVVCVAFIARCLVEPDIHLSVVGLGANKLATSRPAQFAQLVGARRSEALRAVKPQLLVRLAPPYQH